MSHHVTSVGCNAACEVVWVGGYGKGGKHVFGRFRKANAASSEHCRPVLIPVTDPHKNHPLEKEIRWHGWVDEVMKPGYQPEM